MIKLKSLLLEQTGIWQDVPLKNGGQGKGYKFVSAKIGPFPLIDPGTALPWYLDAQNKEERDPIYIFSDLTMTYDDSIQVPKTVDQSRKNPHFQYYISFNLMTEKMSTPAMAWRIFVDKLADGKFHLNAIPYSFSSNATYKSSFVALQNKTDEQTSKRMAGVNFPDYFAQNVKGYAPQLFTQINTELAKYGYPDFPTTLKTGTIII
jgi:hypothetical protein